MRARPHETCAARNGFSLVEVMVVLFIIGLLAGLAVVSMPGDERALRTEAERLAARTMAARDEAVTGGAPVSLVVSDAGYYFERRQDGQWQPFGDARLGLVAWNKGTSAVQSAAQATNAPADPGGSGQRQARSRIVFDTLGLASSDATVQLTRGRVGFSVHIRRDGKVAVDAGQ